MKKIILALLVLIVNVTLVSAQYSNAPEWVNGATHNSLNYVGIGHALKSEKDFQNLAMQRALRSMASQIKVEVSSESVLKTIEEDDEFHSSYKERIEVSTSEQLEQYHLVDQWQNATEYWVYYELNKFDYEEYMKKRIDGAMATALDYLTKGDQAMANGYIETAIKSYAKGLEALDPVMAEDLTCTYNGKKINLGTELYHSLSTIWDGVTVGLNPSSIDMEHLQRDDTPVAVGCYKNGTPLQQITLSAKFISGSGELSNLSATDINGRSILYIRSITSKIAQQQIKIEVTPLYSVAANSWSSLLLKKIKLPYTVLTVNLADSKCTAYIEVEEMELTSLEKSISSMVSSKYFDIVSSPNQADVIMKISSTYELGREVKGDLYNTREHVGGVNIDVIDNRTQKVMTSYNLPEVKSLLQLDKSETQGKNAVSREILKRMNREFPLFLSKISIDKSGDIPQIDSTPEVAPTPVPAPVEPTPAPAPAPEQPKDEVKGLLDTDVWAVYKGFEQLNDKTIIHFTLLNNRDDEYKIELYLNNHIKVYNQSGGSVNVNTVKIGNETGSHNVRATLVSKIPTEMYITVDKLQSIALLQIFSMKLRGFK